MVKSILPLAALGMLTLAGCGQREHVLSHSDQKIQEYRRLDNPPPAAEQAPERYVDSIYGFSYESPDVASQFYPVWQMSKAAAPSRGVFVLRANEVDPTLAEAVISTHIAGQHLDAEAALESFRQRFSGSADLISFERVTIDGHPAAIAQRRFTNPLGTYVMYQCMIPAAERSINLYASAPADDFDQFKSDFRKVILSTKLHKPNIPLPQDGC